MLKAARIFVIGYVRNGDSPSLDIFESGKDSIGKKWRDEAGKFSISDEMVDGEAILYRRESYTSDSLPHRVVRAEDLNKLFGEKHVDKEGTHGTKAQLRQSVQSVYIPKVAEACENYVNDCFICQLEEAKRLEKRLEAEIQRVHRVPADEAFMFAPINDAPICPLGPSSNKMTVDSPGPDRQPNKSSVRPSQIPIGKPVAIDCKEGSPLTPRALRHSARSMLKEQTATPRTPSDQPAMNNRHQDMRTTPRADNLSADSRLGLTPKTPRVDRTKTGKVQSAIARGDHSKLPPLVEGKIAPDASTRKPVKRSLNIMGGLIMEATRKRSPSPYPNGLHTASAMSHETDHPPIRRQATMPVIPVSGHVTIARRQKRTQDDSANSPLSTQPPNKKLKLAVPGTQEHTNWICKTKKMATSVNGEETLFLAMDVETGTVCMMGMVKEDAISWTKFIKVELFKYCGRRPVHITLHNSLSCATFKTIKTNVMSACEAAQVSITMGGWCRSLWHRLDRLDDAVSASFVSQPYMRACWGIGVQMFASDVNADTMGKIGVFPYGRLYSWTRRDANSQRLPLGIESEMESIYDGETVDEHGWVHVEQLGSIRHGKDQGGRAENAISKPADSFIRPWVYVEPGEAKMDIVAKTFAAVDLTGATVSGQAHNGRAAIEQPVEAMEPHHGKILQAVKTWQLQGESDGSVTQDFGDGAAIEGIENKLGDVQDDRKTGDN